MNKDDEIQNSFTYHFVDTDDLKKGITSANKRFKEFVRDNGWARKAKLKSILQISQANAKIPTVTVAPPKPVGKRSKSTRRPSSRPRSRKTT